MVVQRPLGGQERAEPSPLDATGELGKSSSGDSSLIKMESRDGRSG